MSALCDTCRATGNIQRHADDCEAAYSPCAAHDTVLVTCDRCKGSGKGACPRCRGTGMATCDMGHDHPCGCGNARGCDACCGAGRVWRPCSVCRSVTAKTRFNRQTAPRACKCPISNCPACGGKGVVVTAKPNA